MTNYQTNLKEKIEDSLKELSSYAATLISMTGAAQKTRKLKPEHLDYSLASYKGMVYLSTLVKIYNENFNDPEVQQAQKLVDTLLESTEKEFLELGRDVIKEKFS